MKKIFFCIILFFNFSNVLSEETIHFLDIEFILNNSNSGKIIIEEPYPFGLIKVIDPDFKEFANTELVCGESKVKILEPEWI